MSKQNCVSGRGKPGKSFRKRGLDPETRVKIDKLWVCAAISLPSREANAAWHCHAHRSCPGKHPLGSCKGKGKTETQQEGRTSQLCKIWEKSALQIWEKSALQICISFLQLCQRHRNLFEIHGGTFICPSAAPNPFNQEQLSGLETAAQAALGNYFTRLPKSGFGELGSREGPKGKVFLCLTFLGCTARV